MNFKNFLIAGVACLTAIPFATAAAELPEVFQILPEPQQVEVTSLSGVKGDDLKWITVTEGDEMPVLGAYLDALPRYKADGKGVMLVKTDKDVPESEEGYVLEIRKDGAVISSKGDAGLFYGCATLEQLITDSRESGTAIPRMTITDWPAIPYRAIHIDNKNHLDRVEYYYELIDKLASYKINGIIWEIEDKLQYSRRPEVAAPNAISKQEMQAISRYAKERHIEISPLIQGLGHATYILKHHWELREDPKNDGDFCPSNPETYEVLVSSTGTETADFEKLLTVENDANQPGLHGVDLSKYDGKEIYLAIRLVTADGYFLTIDNVGFYGNVSLAQGGISSIADNNWKVTVSSEELTCTADNVSNIAVYDMSGRFVAGSDTETVNISGLQKGIYIASITADGSTLQYKFAK